MIWLRRFMRPLLTCLVLCLAIGLGYIVWDIYVLDPWTRDGRVRVYVVNSAPEVSGTVVSVPVVDNQFVHRGDPLFVIDPLRFRLKIDEAKARLVGVTEDYKLSVSNARRRKGLGGVVSREEQDDFNSVMETRRARVEEAQSDLDTARLNLQRSTVYSAVDGYVTNLNLRVGDYLQAGQTRMAVIDANSYWVNGYFEETKMHGVRVGDPARIKLMGYRQVLRGHVVSIGRGINDRNGVSDRLGLPDVNPIFTWVRLAQRIPVRIEFDDVPADLTLSAGMTATVAAGLEKKGGRGLLITWLQNHL